MEELGKWEKLKEEMNVAFFMVPSCYEAGI
jgi:hypothetical protein